MICSKCGKDNPDGGWACSVCGEPLGAAGPPPGQSAAPYPGRPPQPASKPAKKGSRGSGITIILAVLLVIVIVAVPTWYYLSRSPDQSTPSGTVEAYFNAISDNDCKKLYELSPNDMVADMSDEAINACSAFMGIMNLDLSDYKSLDERIDGDTALVDFEITMEFGGMKTTEQATASLIKEDGIWKIESGLS
jgi:hypothetical protein